MLIFRASWFHRKPVPGCVYWKTASRGDLWNIRCATTSQSHALYSGGDLQHMARRVSYTTRPNPSNFDSNPSNDFSLTPHRSYWSYWNRHHLRRIFFCPGSRRTDRPMVNALTLEYLITGKAEGPEIFRPFAILVVWSFFTIKAVLLSFKEKP